MVILENLIDTTESTFTSNRNGRIVDWNESNERLLGYESSYVFGKHGFVVFDSKKIPEFIRGLEFRLAD